MSFVDLATLAIHRRSELEARINSFNNKCEIAITNIQKLQNQVHGLTEQLNCEPSNLKDRFLNCMKQIDEYTYIITEFNLGFEKNCDAKSSISEDLPVHDNYTIRNATSLSNTSHVNLMDLLCEQTPLTPTVCAYQCTVQKPNKIKTAVIKPKNIDNLIYFSSNSCSSESVPDKPKTDEEQNDRIEDVNDEEEKIENERASSDETENQIIEEVLPTKTTPEDPKIVQINLPAQTVLQTGTKYSGAITSVDGNIIWVLVGDPSQPYELIVAMTKYYKDTSNHVKLNDEEISALTYCAFYDKETDNYFRGFFVRIIENDEAELFLVDTGEISTTHMKDLQPLAPQFCNDPPYARSCHLAGVDLLSHSNEDLFDKQEDFLRQFVGNICEIEVDDNSCESLSVYLTLDLPTEGYIGKPMRGTLNDLIIKEGLAISLDENTKVKEEVQEKTNKDTHSAPEIREELKEEINITDCPEYEDPVLAVTGYHNRDEADICKHYRGGSDRYCFKGTRCTKKHIMKHPDGWTLDRVEVQGMCRSLPLPAPGSWHRVRVSCVAHYNVVYVQYVPPKQTVASIESKPFGVMLPPKDLNALCIDMNSAPSRKALKPLTLRPAPGELVAAMYEDGMWYRAKVLSLSHIEQTVEVLYIDYGNFMMVSEDSIRVLPARFWALPAQASMVRLAGAVAASEDSALWARAKDKLMHLTLNEDLDMHVISRDYDEITAELYDRNSNNIVELMAKTNLLKLEPYDVVYDTHITRRHVVP